MYADDLVIMAPSVAGLSKLLKMCESFGASHDMIFNQKKSASVYFISETLKGAHLPNVYLNGEVILQVDSVKYLGHYITNDLHDDLDIRRQYVVPLITGVDRWGTGGTRPPHFSAWWGPHRKCPPHFFA